MTAAAWCRPAARGGFVLPTCDIVPPNPPPQVRIASQIQGLLTSVSDHETGAVTSPALMRLLDLIAQGRAEPIIAANGMELPRADVFSKNIQTCPLRFVLADELVLMATALAFAEGDRLDSCLDLVHVPAERLWVEWLDAPRQSAVQELLRLPWHPVDGEVQHRSGTLLTARPDGRSGTIRGFWSTPDSDATLSPVITEFHLDRSLHTSNKLESMLTGGWTTVSDLCDPSIHGVLSHFRHRLDPAWIAYYQAHDLTEEQRCATVRGNLNGVAFDGPMLLAFFLLLDAKSSLPRCASDLGRLNRARFKAGKMPLLEHVEVKAPLESPSPHSGRQPSEHGRRTARLHHVRGHLVRRGACVFWRCPHMRGSARWGEIRTRTVELRYTRGAVQ